MGELGTSLGDNKGAASAYLKLADWEPENAEQYLAKGYELNSADPQLALVYARILIEAAKPDKAAEVVAPHAKAPNSEVEFRETYARALMAAKRPEEAEPFVWDLVQKDPKKTEDISRLIEALIVNEKHDQALAAARKLEALMNKLNLRREFVSLMKEAISKHPPGADYLEYMVGVYNSANREQDYCETLVQLFSLYYAAGNFLKAADSLERAIEVDPYQPGNQRT